MNPRRVNPGFSVIEAVLSTLVIGIMLVAVLNTVGAARTAQVWNSDRLRAACLASTLLAEITDQAYAEPTELPLFGPEASELLATRSAFDDVDDYNGWSKSPPENADGTAIPGYSSDWRRSVSVVYAATSANPAANSLTDTGLKRITVTVSRRGIKLAELTAVRAQGVLR
jgi:type II secretory pathway pseudopilin PulG